MRPRHIALLIAAASIAILAYGLNRQRLYPPRVISEGKVQVEDRSGTGRRASVRTRRVAVGGIERDEAELAPGTWIDCARDCREAIASAAGPGFWEKQQQRSR